MCGTGSKRLGPRTGDARLSGAPWGASACLGCLGGSCGGTWGAVDKVWGGVIKNTGTRCCSGSGNDEGECSRVRGDPRGSGNGPPRGIGLLGSETRRDQWGSERSTLVGCGNIASLIHMYAGFQNTWGSTRSDWRSGSNPSVVTTMGRTWRPPCGGEAAIKTEEILWEHQQEWMSTWLQTTALSTKTLAKQPAPPPPAASAATTMSAGTCSRDTLPSGTGTGTLNTFWNGSTAGLTWCQAEQAGIKAGFPGAVHSKIAGDANMAVGLLRFHERRAHATTVWN
ncbi:hypothetical protein B0H10DRAFT_1958719 [Mycena sp. CBHHK59/15]|nr:hypothetical protein B0H10DRAFT_1958719 [Mycena sp. CBHHK59/15]